MAAIIFDFDGTIADSLNYFIDFISREAKLEPLSLKEKKALSGLTLSEIARRLGHPWWRLPYLYYKGRNEMYGKLIKIEPFKDMTRVIKKLHAEGHELFIVSSNSVRNVRRFLRRQGLRYSFMEIYGGAILKPSILKDLVREHQLDAKQTYYVGDELRDIAAAGAAGLKSVAVSWGFADKTMLEAAKPLTVVDTPADLLKVLETL